MLAIRSLLWTVSFLTIIPTGRSSYGPPPSMGWIAFWFPWVGGIVGVGGGCVLYGAHNLTGDTTVAALLTVVFIAVMTRALHLDGLADSFDGFLGGADREKRLAVMRDSHIGTFGMVALLLTLFLEVELLSALAAMQTSGQKPELRLAATLAFTAPMIMVGRWAMVYGMAMGSYAREGQGTGKFFCDFTTPLHFLWASLFPLAVLFCLFGFAGIMLVILAILCASAMTAIANRMIGGVTGDTLGATGELAQVVYLLAMAILLFCCAGFASSPFGRLW